MHRFIVLAATPWFFAILDRFGVAGAFLFVLAENFGVPIPGETMLVFASAYAATGHLNVVALTIFCIAGIWLGSTLSYLAGRRGGVALLTRLHVPEQHLGRAQSYMDRWGGYTILFGRYVAFLRSYLGWLGGINRMAIVPFMLWNLAGAVVWTLTFVTIGYLLGHNLAVIEQLLRVIGYGGVALVVLAVVAIIAVRRVRSGQRARREEEGVSTLPLSNEP